MPVDQTLQSVAPLVDRGAAPGLGVQSETTERIWRELEAANFRLDRRHLDRLAQLYSLDEAAIKRLIFLRYRLMSKRN